MIWKTTGKVQNVSALLCQGINISPVLDRLTSGPKALQDIELAQGEGWQVIFGKTYNSEEVLLPHIEDSQPLFKAFPDIWMCVGATFNLPSRVQGDYIEKIRSDHELSGNELVIFPHFLNDADTTDKADIFVIQQRLPVSELALRMAV